MEAEVMVEFTARKYYQITASNEKDAKKKAEAMFIQEFLRQEKLLEKHGVCVDENCQSEVVMTH